MESVPAIATLVFTDQAVPHIYINGFKYKPSYPPHIIDGRWYWYCPNNQNCKTFILTSIPLYNLVVLHYNDSILHNHPKPRPRPSYSPDCYWRLYKYDFSRLHEHQYMAQGMIWKGEVSNVHDMLMLLQNNKIEDDPTAPGRCHYCFFRSHISTEWPDGSLNQSGGKFKLEFEKPFEVTRENLHDYWKALLTCIMQGTFGTYTEYINGVKVDFSGIETPPFISVWTSVDFTTSEPKSPPILGKMLRKLFEFEPSVDVTFYKHVTNELYF